MSDEGEKTCPLCAEEMDLTDQQLKPCKCGYEICVWCWHHIMDMAEKDETEGRCPACRTPYNKQKIVGMAAKCERLVSEINVEKKLRSQKGKSKTSEGRKQLGSVRVIQRNLVYVVGLPLSFADEDLLQRREYFGQYGKVLKVSISRTAAGAIQQFANSTCSIYITYSKEEEAVRCIKTVHGFVLDGRPLRACFGTTKYCHAWLRNVPCSNPDCLYLHEIGSQEDSFTKDEIISAYTRSRVQNITGTSNSLQRRSGNVLPPPADEYYSNNSASSGKPIIKTSINSNNSAVSARVSPPNSSAGRSAALPAGASWGTRPSINQTSPASSPFSNGPTKQKPDTSNALVEFSTAVSSSSQVSLLPGDAEKLVPSEEICVCQDKSKVETGEPVIEKSFANRITTVPDSSYASVLPATLTINRLPDSPPTTKPPITTDIVDSLVRSSRPASEIHSPDAADVDMENIRSDILSMRIHENHKLHNGFNEQDREPQTSGKTANTGEEVTDFQSDFRSGSPTRIMSADLLELENDLLSFDKQRMKDPEVATSRVQEFSHSFHLSKHSNNHALPFNKADDLVSADLDRQVGERNDSFVVCTSNFSSWHPENILNSPEVDNVEYSNVLSRKNKKVLLGRYEGEVASGAVDMGESSIISNILSMDFESWDDSLTSPQHMAKLLCETDKRQGPLGVPLSRKIQNSNQSRFSFAREEESTGQKSDHGQSIDYHEQALKPQPFTHDFSGSNNLRLEKIVAQNCFPVSKSSESDIFLSSHSHVSANKISVSRSQISAPPGFSVPSRPPPPGFIAHERTEQILDLFSGNYMLDGSSLLKNPYQTPSSGSTISNGDIEFMDPAILAVGKGTLSGSAIGPALDLRSNISSQLSSYEDARFHSFLQGSLPQHQNQRFTDTGDSFSPLGSAYGIPSRIMEQTLANNLSPFPQFNLPQSRNGITSNGQWDGWNEVQGGNSLSVAELLRTERLGFNKYYSGYEDSKIHMPSSGNLYNGTYGI